MLDTVILGSGYFSAGFALNHEGTLVIEETQLLDPNFCARLSGFAMDAERPSSPDAASLFDTLLKEGVFNNGKMAVNELEPAFCRFLEKRALNILLGSFCTGLKRKDDGFELEICNNEGISRISAKRVIDARVPCGGRMNLLVALKDGTLPRIEGAAPAFYPDQCTLSADLDRVTDINEAKSLILEKFEDALAEAGARIVLTSYRMDGAPIEDAYTDAIGVLHIDERAFGDIFSAYEKGECLV